MGYSVIFVDAWAGLIYQDLSLEFHFWGTVGSGTKYGYF